MTLKSGSHEAIVNMFNQYRSDINDIIRSLIQLTYFMRGAISYSELMDKSHMERELIGEFIASRLEQESNRPYPVY